MDERNAVVVRGRNREGEREAPAGSLAGTYLAHAEINALAALPRHRHPGHRLLVSLAPCLMCAAAIVLTEVSEVEYAAADPVMEDVSGWLGALPFAADRLPVIRGPLDGPVRRFAELLPVMHMVEFRRRSRSLAVRRSRQPELMRRAEELLDDRPRLRNLPYPAAFEAITADPAGGGQPGSTS